MARTSLGTRFDTGDSFLELELRPEPLSLSVDEIDPKNDPPRSPKAAIEVLVWLTFLTRDGPKAIRVPAMARQFNSRCVWVEGTIRAWTFNTVVWASAVTRRHAPTPAPNRTAPQTAHSNQAALGAALLARPGRK